MNQLTKPQIKKYKIERAILFKVSNHSMYVHKNIAITIVSDLKTIKLRSDLGFNQIDMILKKEPSVLIPILKAISAGKIKLQHKALENERVRTDMYFSEHKFAVEIDGKEHKSRQRKRKTNKNRKTY